MKYIELLPSTVQLVRTPSASPAKHYFAQTQSTQTQSTLVEAIKGTLFALEEYHSEKISDFLQQISAFHRQYDSLTHLLYSLHD